MVSLCGFGAYPGACPVDQAGENRDSWGHGLLQPMLTSSFQKPELIKALWLPAGVITGMHHMPTCLCNEIHWCLEHPGLIFWPFPCFSILCFCSLYLLFIVKMILWNLNITFCFILLSLRVACFEFLDTVSPCLHVEDILQIAKDSWLVGI